MSLKAKIRNIAKKKNIPAQVILQNYMFERLLVRLSASAYKEKFVLKGGMLVAAIVGLDNRATMDLDTTLKNLPLTPDAIRSALEQVCAISLDDGVVFEIGTISPIREDDIYGGYGVVGGTPQYLMQMDDNLSIEENIKNTHLNPSSSIFEEPNNLLKQEVREPAIYNAVITAIATGCSKMNEISTKIDEDTSVCATYIKNLIALGIVKKESPYGEKSSRRTIYSIEDNMFRFWYRFVPENTSVISRGATDLAYRRIAPELSSYMGAVFEEICRQYLWKLLLDGKCAVNFSDLGRWWGTNSKTRTQEEIDIMGTDKDVALFAECKWTNEKVDLGVLETLVERSSLFN